MTSSNLTYLPKVLTPNTIILGGESFSMLIWGDIIQSIAEVLSKGRWSHPNSVFELLFWLMCRKGIEGIKAVCRMPAERLFQ